MAFPFRFILKVGKVLTDVVGLTNKVDEVVDVVEDVVEVVKTSIPKVDRQSAWEVLEQVVTEERTDELIEKLVKQVKPKLPVWLRWLPITYVLDAIFPELVLGWLKDLLIKE